MESVNRSGKLVVMIASPLEQEHVERIQQFDPHRIEVLHDPGLSPTPRYVADHNGVPRELTPAQCNRWAKNLERADILFDVDRTDPANLRTNAPRLRWVQATSSGIGEFLKRTGLNSSNIVFTTAAGVHSRPLAEFALLGLLYFFRDMPQLEAMKKARHWERYTVEGLDGKRALVIGMGAVGRQVARQCASFGMDVWGTRRSPDGNLPEGCRAGSANQSSPPFCLWWTLLFSPVPSPTKLASSSAHRSYGPKAWGSPGEHRPRRRHR